MRQLEGESAAGIREKIRNRNTVRRKSSLCESKDLLYMLIVNIYIYIYIYIERERERELGSSYTWCNSIFFNWMQILTNLQSNYIIFIYFPYLQNFKVIKD